MTDTGINRRDLFAVCRKAREEGYAITIFTPEELRAACIEDVEDRMVAAGQSAIDLLSLEAETQEGT